MKNLLKITFAYALGLFFWTFAGASDYELALPDAGGKAGENVTVELTLDNAASVAGAFIQLNFNPEILNFVSVNDAGTLNTAFDVDYEEDDGRLFLYFTTVNAEVLSSGSGVLCSLTFQVNTGAVPGLYSELTMAEVVMTDEMGISLSWEQNVVANNGQITCGNISFVDSDNDSLPDEWEQSYFADIGSVLNTADDDGDGISNLMEYALGSDPSVYGLSRLPVQGMFEYLGKHYLTLTFNRQIVAPTIRYHVEASPDMQSWSSGDIAQLGVAEDNGDGTEEASYQDTEAIEDHAARFIRLRVEGVGNP